MSSRGGTIAERFYFWLSEIASFRKKMFALLLVIVFIVTATAADLPQCPAGSKQVPACETITDSAPCTSGIVFSQEIVNSTVIGSISFLRCYWNGVDCQRMSGQNNTCSGLPRCPSGYQTGKCDGADQSTCPHLLVPTSQGSANFSVCAWNGQVCDYGPVVCVWR